MTRRFIILAIASSPLFAECNPDDFENTCLSEASPCTFCHKDRAGPLVLKASFLIWQSKEWGLEFASKSFASSNPSENIQTFQQKLSIPDFSWSPGFKIDFGYTLPYDGWDVNNRWTFYHGDLTNLKKHHDMQIAPTGYGIVPLWHYPFFDIVDTSSPLRFQNAAANWKLYFNSFDADLGRWFSPAKSLLFRINLGAKGSWIRQHYHVDYHDSAIVTGIILPPNPVSVHILHSRMVFNSRCWGIGPRSGLETKWKFGWGFSLVAGGAFSCLYTNWNTTTEFHDQLSISSQNEIENLHMTDHRWELIPVFDGNLGIDWGWCFGRTEKPIYFSLMVAYEIQYWWAQNLARRNFAFHSPGNMWDMRGDLQMQGLTASIRSDF
jgi:hypothetical protein